MGTRQPGLLGSWILAARPKTLSAGAVPVAVGTAVAHVCGGVRLLPALAALVGALLLQIASNFANDVFDHEKGADTDARLGPQRAVASGLISGRAMRRALAVTLGLTLPVGIYLTAVGGWPIVAIGLCSMLAAVAYTGGPHPLGYNGLGDLFVLLFFGFVAVCGTAYVQLGTVPSLAYWAAVPVGALATAILVVNNVRDRVTDAVAGKRTLAVRLGRNAALLEYGALVALAYLVPAGLVASGVLGPAALLPLLSLPLAVWLVLRVSRDEGRALNRSLAMTAQLLALHGALFASGIALSAS